MKTDIGDAQCNIYKNKRDKEEEEEEEETTDY